MSVPRVSTLRGHRGTGDAKYQTLTESLEELERTNPDVKKAADAYDEMVARWRFRKELGLDRKENDHGVG